jgi:hypothetical protein
VVALSRANVASQLNEPGSGSYRHSETGQKNRRARENSHERHIAFGKGLDFSSAAICLRRSEVMVT